MINRDTPGQPADDAMLHRRWQSLFQTLLLLASAVLILAACGGRSASGTKISAGERETIIRQAALQYVRDANLPKAKETIAKLNLANPAQIVLSMAEQAVNDGKPSADIVALARLAEGLGARSPKLVAYLAPTATSSPLPRPTSTIAPPSPTTIPPPATLDPAPATLAPPSTVVAAAPTTAPTATASPLPQKPRVVADSAANLRGGPGTSYPTIGQMAVGKEVDIIGRNTNGDWWRIAWDGAGQAWVAGLVVRVLGPIDTIAIVKDIPVLPTRPPAPPTRPPAPTEPPKPVGPDFQLASVRVWGVEENGGYYDGASVHCGEKRELHIKVLDAAGNPLNGVTVKAALGAQEEIVTGSKGVPGNAEFVLGGGQEVYIVRDVDGRQVTSDMARGMSTNPHGISFDTLKGAGYCKDDAGCASFVNQNGCYGHYSWTVTFRRNR
jgi:hypothetical protein